MKFVIIPWWQNEEIIRNMDTWGYQVPYRMEEEEE